MTIPASNLPRYGVDGYFALADEGVFAADERTELLDGMVVAMAPQSPLHAAGVYRVESALRAAFPTTTVIRVHMSLVASPWSVPEPDVAVVLGGEGDYIDRHPGTALLVVEVAISTVAQDRLTKAAIYAQAGVTNYWIVQPADSSVVVHSKVRPELCAYEQVSHVRSATVLVLDGLENVAIQSEDLFPRRAG